MNEPKGRRAEGKGRAACNYRRSHLWSHEPRARGEKARPKPSPCTLPLHFPRPARGSNSRALVQGRARRTGEHSVLLQRKCTENGVRREYRVSVHIILSVVPIMLCTKYHRKQVQNLFRTPLKMDSLGKLLTRNALYLFCPFFFSRSAVRQGAPLHARRSSQSAFTTSLPASAHQDFAPSLLLSRGKAVRPGKDMQVSTPHYLFWRLLWSSLL